MYRSALQLKPVTVQPEPQADAPLKTIQIALTRRRVHTILVTLLVVLAVVLGVFARYAYTAYDKVGFFEARLQASYETADNGDKGWVLEVRGEDVYLMQMTDEWTFQPIRYRFPHLHDAMASLLGTDKNLIRETQWMRTDRSVWIDAADMQVSFSGSSGTWQVIRSEPVAWDTVEWPE